MTPIIQEMQLTQTCIYYRCLKERRAGRCVFSGSRTAFTLIELLLVISIVAVLMGVMIPALGHARKQSKSVVCRSQLRGLSTAFWLYIQDNDSMIPGDIFWPSQMRPFYDNEEQLLCPVARKPNDYLKGVAPDYWYGSTYTAWSSYPGDPSRTFAGSYGINYRFVNPKPDDPLSHSRRYITGGSYTPLLMDCKNTRSGNSSTWPAPEHEDILFPIPHSTWWDVCMNRHNRTTNMLFLDLSGRSVSLKELWTLKWNPDFDTSDCWTLAGEVVPSEWPKWLRYYPEY